MSRKSVPKTRGEAFALCRDETMKELRQRYALSGVKYNTQMTDDELRGLWEYLGAADIDSMNALLTYDGMDTASQILCRWPRPSELGRLSWMLGQKKLMYYRAVLKVKAEVKDDEKNPQGYANRTFGRIVGPMGSNFIGMTKNHDLMYLWMHHVTDRAVDSFRQRQIFVYAKNRGDLDAGLQAIEDYLASFDIHTLSKAVRVMPLRPDAPEWYPIKSGLNVHAKPFAPSTQTAAVRRRTSTQTQSRRSRIAS